MSRSAILDGIEKKVARLIADNRRLRDDRDRLTESRKKLREENRMLTEKVAELERRLTVKGLVDGFSGETADSKSVKAARASINRLMWEVNRCIALVNSKD